jgi:hypothetical protein
MTAPFDVSVLMDVHPDDYHRVVDYHAARLSDQDKKEMVAMFVATVSKFIIDPDDELESEEKAIGAFYCSHLFIHIFHELFNKTEEHLARAKKLNNLLDK